MWVWEDYEGVAQPDGASRGRHGGHKGRSESGVNPQRLRNGGDGRGKTRRHLLYHRG